MASNYRVLFSSHLSEDLAHLPKNIRDSIIRTIESKLSVYPNMYGERLRHDLKGYWKLKISKYRVVYEIDGKVVKIC